MNHPNLSSDSEPSLPDLGSLHRHAKDARMRHFPRGTTLYQPGLIEFVGFVAVGTVKLITAQPDGRTNIVSLIQAPGFFGRVFGVASEFTIEAATDVIALCLERAAFETQLSDNPALEHFIHLENLYQLDEAHERIIVLACPSVMERLATYMVLRLISEETEKGGRSVQTNIHVPINRRDFAAYLCTTVETVSRSIQALVRRGTIAVVDSTNFRVLRRGDLVDVARQSEDDLREMVRSRASKTQANSTLIKMSEQVTTHRRPAGASLGVRIAAE